MLLNYQTRIDFSKWFFLWHDHKDQMALGMQEKFILIHHALPALLNLHIISAQSNKCRFSMSIISSELIYRSLLYFIWFLCWAVNLSPGELCLTDYVLTYDIIFFKEHDLKTLISIAVYSSFSSRLIVCLWQGCEWWNGESKTRIRETS